MALLTQPETKNLPMNPTLPLSVKPTPFVPLTFRHPKAVVTRVLEAPQHHHLLTNIHRSDYRPVQHLR
jgi:hypothetical protein